MCEHSSNGTRCSADPKRIAAYCKVSESTVWNVIAGYENVRTGERVKGLLERGILTQLAPGNWAKRKCATYRINEAAMHLDPRMKPYLNDAPEELGVEAQATLPGIRRPWEPKIQDAPADSPAPLVQPLDQSAKPTDPTVGLHWSNGWVQLVQPLGSTGPTVGLDSISIDSNPIDSKPSDSSGGVRNSLHTVPQNPTTQPLSGQVHEIASLYPKIRDAFHLPPEIYNAIATALARDGRDLVWIGTKSVAEAVDKWPRHELRFLPSPVKFFRESHYRADPAEWARKEESGADDYAQRCDDERELLRRHQVARGTSA